MKYCDTALVYSPYKYALCKDENDFYKEIKKLGVPEHLCTPLVETDGACVWAIEDMNICLVVLGEEAKEQDEISIHAMLVHEAVHIWQYIKERLGENKPSPEFEAYSIQNISQNLMEQYNG